MKYIPFSSNELTPAGSFYIYPTGNLPKYSTPVSPKENYQLALSGQKPFWAPMFSDCRKYVTSIIPDNAVRGILPGSEPINPEDLTGGKDMFGIDWVYVPEAKGATVRPGNPFVSDPEDLMEKTRWPDVHAWDWEGAAQRSADYRNTDFLLGTIFFCGFFERLISFMDFENAIVSLIDDDSKLCVHRFFDRLTSLYEEIIPLLRKHFSLDAIEFHDDWGSQRAPLFSLNTVNEMILPYLKRVAACAHDQGMIFELHSCGCHKEHTPAMIEAGVDYWAPQPNANDTAAIFEEYGEHISIGIACPLPPDSSDEDYIRWGESYVETFIGRSGKRTPVLNNMRSPEILRRTVYEASRKKLCGCRVF